MTNPAVVILTDPARCELADADALLKALLEVQQLNSAGVPASQAFCDHPTAAMEFIDAYTTAYPELQQQSSGLPLPEVLHTMVADGRFGPLLAPGPVEPGKPQEAGQVYPLYVLSLGAPEALMQAMEQNPMASNNIRVLEVAPIEPPKPESVRVAEAVAQEPPARSSLFSESPTTLQSETEEATSLEAVQDSEPLELDSVEVNLNHIEVGTNDHQKSYDQNDSTFDGPEPTFAAILPAGSGVADGVPQANLSSEAAPSASVGSTAPAVLPTPVPASVLAPAMETLSTSLIEPTIVTVATGSAPDQSGSSPDIAPAPMTDPEQSPGSGAGTTADGQASGEPPKGAPPDQAPAAGDSGMENDGQNSAQGENGFDSENGSPSGAVPGPEEAPVAASGRVAEQEAGTAPAASFADPGEDVLYPPTGNFAWSNDLPYGLPEDSIPEINTFEDLFDMASHAEVVDLEALYRDVQTSPGTSALTVERLDFASLRAPTSNGPNPSDYPASNPTPHGTAPSRETHDTDHDEAHHEPLMTAHDADL